MTPLTRTDLWPAPSSASGEGRWFETCYVLRPLYYFFLTWAGSILLQVPPRFDPAFSGSRLVRVSFSSWEWKVRERSSLRHSPTRLVQASSTPQLASSSTRPRAASFTAARSCRRCRLLGRCASGKVCACTFIRAALLDVGAALRESVFGSLSDTTTPCQGTVWHL